MWRKDTAARPKYNLDVFYNANNLQPEHDEDSYVKCAATISYRHNYAKNKYLYHGRYTIEHINPNPMLFTTKIPRNNNIDMFV